MQFSLLVAGSIYNNILDVMPWCCCGQSSARCLTLPPTPSAVVCAHRISYLHLRGREDHKIRSDDGAVPGALALIKAVLLLVQVGIFPAGVEWDRGNKNMFFFPQI